MTDELFQILGGTCNQMFGREKLTNVFLRGLRNEGLMHFSLVGPKHMGKSVFMNNLKNRVKKTSDINFTYAIFWDMGSLNNYNDTSLLYELAKKLSEAIRGDDKETSEYLISADEEDKDKIFITIEEALQHLKKKNKRILMYWDNVDRVMRSPDIKIGFWDKMRRLTGINLQLIIASRDDLKESISDEKSKDSTFWGIFKIHRLEKFSAEDVDEILKKTGRTDWSQDNKTDLEKYTGLFPPLLLSLLNIIHAKGVTELNSEAFDTLARKLKEGAQIPEMLDEIYEDLVKDKKLKNAFESIITGEGIQRASIPDQFRGKLLDYGFCKERDGKIYQNCQLLTDYVNNLGESSGSVRMLFVGNNYHKNIKELLKIKLERIQGIDEYLHRHIGRYIECINTEDPNNRNDLQENLKYHRNTIDKIFEIIWTEEFGGREIPDKIYDYWNGLAEGKLASFKLYKEIPDAGDDRVKEKIILDLLTGRPYRKITPDRKAEYITKGTANLCDALYTYTNYGQHTGGAIRFDTVVATIYTAIECANSLSMDLKTSKRE